MSAKLTNLESAYKPAEKAKQIKALSTPHTSVPDPCFQTLSKTYGPEVPNLLPLFSNGFLRQFPNLFRTRKGSGSRVRAA